MSSKVHIHQLIWIYDDSPVCYCNSPSLLPSYHIPYRWKLYHGPQCSHLSQNKIIHSLPWPTHLSTNSPSYFSFYHCNSTLTHSALFFQHTKHIPTTKFIHLLGMPSFLYPYGSITAFSCQIPLKFFAFHSIFFFFLSLALDWQLSVFNCFLVNSLYPTRV